MNRRLNLSVEKILLDEKNYRTGPQPSQRDAARAIIEDQGDKLVNLGKDIAEFGLSEDRQLIVEKHPTEKGHYTVLNGNRRITAIKTVLNPNLALGLPTAKKFKDLHDKYAKKIITEVECVELAEDVAKRIIRREHYKGQQGLGVEPWSPLGRARADADDGKGVGVLDALQFVMSGNVLQQDVRDLVLNEDFSLSTFQRIINSKPIRDSLGLTQGKSSLLCKKSRDWLMLVLSEMVTAIAKEKFGHKIINSRTLNDAATLGEFADEVIAKVGTAKRAAEWTVGSDTAPQIPQRPKKVRKPKPIKSKASWDRLTIVPAEYPVTGFTNHPKLNNVYGELKTLQVKDTPNAGAMLFRSLLELTVRQYIKDHSIQCGQDPTVKSMCELSLTDLVQDKKTIDRTESARIKSLLQGMPLAISTQLNDYVHHRDFHPEWRELNTRWDNIEPFLAALWDQLK